MQFANVSTSRYAEFADELRARIDAVRATMPAALPGAPADLLETALDDLDDAEEELRSQNEELFRSRTEVEASTAQLLALFEMAPAAYLLTRYDGCIIRANDAACRLLRRPLNAIAGKPLACYVALAERAAFRAAFARSRESEVVDEWPIQIEPRHAEPLDCRIHSRALPRSGPDDAAVALIVAPTLGDVLDEF